MNRVGSPTPLQWRNEALVLALVVVVAFGTPPFFDQPPLNVLSVLLVLLHVGWRIWTYREPPKP